MMIGWTNFENVFLSKPDYALDQKLIDAINRNRKELGGILFFDKIWTSIGLRQSQKIYPPKSNAELRNLWQKIAKAEVAEEKKQALLFYVLRDCRLPNNVDTTFAQKVYLPSKYQILVAGLWDLDHLQFSRALEHLTDPSLNPEFADDILLTLLESPKCEDALAIAYYLTVRPSLAKQKTLEAYFDLLARTNIVEAYHFCRQRDISQYKLLFQELIRSVHEENVSPTKARRILTLLSLPFSEDEESWFDEYLLRGQGSRLPGAKDSILVRRLVQTQSLSGSGILDRHRGHKLNDMNWDDIRDITRTTFA